MTGGFEPFRGYFFHMGKAREEGEPKGLESLKVVSHIGKAGASLVGGRRRTERFCPSTQPEDQYMKSQGGEGRSRLF